ncbi:tRNA(Glu)-specific nuclease WapA precursor [compost metagenome]
MGRVIMAGLANNDGQTRQAVQTSVNNQTVALWEDRDASTLGYTTRTYPNTSATSVEIFMVNYYDDYTFAAPTGYNYVADTLNVQGCMSNGLLTASKIKVLDGTANYLWTVNYYDKEGRLIQQHKQNYIGGKDLINTKYSFTGQPLVVKRVHTNGKGINAQTFLYWYQYDHMDRKKRVLHKVINGTVNATAQPVILIDYAYNELGQLTAKKLHSIDKGVSYSQVVDYQYTSQGWLKKINDPAQISATSADKADKFALELKYDNGSVPQFNGNISNMVWRGTRFSAPTMEYGFSYDKLNRLLKAKSLEGGNYEERIDDYDLMGNILKLSRMSNNDLIDSLVYTYKVPNLSNQLDRVDEKSASTNKTLGFNEIGSIQQTGEYSYDANGNMLTDKNAGITINIIYNHLNLPQTIVKGTTTINYLYDALGRKLRKTVGTTIDDYIDGLQLQTVGSTTTIKFIATEEGRANWNGETNPYYYHYDLKDHLGNIRVTINEAGAVLQEDSYYAFGMQMPGKSFNATNKYLYNGKEIQTETGWYDHGARQYNPVLGRWNVVDPLAEKMRRHSPYTFVFNNPLRFLDQDGMVGNDWIKNIRTNEVKWKDDINEFTRFAANSEWQYFGKAGTTYHTANGTKQVLLGDNGHWSYINNQRNFNWREFTSQVNELKPMLDATATGITVTTYGMAAVASGGVGLSASSLGAGAADFGVQMFFNGGDINKVNWTSVGSMALFKSPLTANMVASGMQYSFSEGLDNSLLGNKSGSVFAAESAGGAAFGALGNHWLSQVELPSETTFKAAKEKRSIILQLIGIAIIIGAFITMVVKNEDRFRHRTEICQAIIISSGNSYKGELTLDYEFRVGNKIYKGAAGPYTKIPSRNYSDFQGKSFSVIYEKNKPENSGLLLTPSNFERYNIPYPDSLKWIEKKYFMK